MTELSRLSRRERQIMEIVYGGSGVTIHQICAKLDGSPTPMATRRMVAILMEKGHLKRQKQGREFVYIARQSRTRAGLKALRQVLTTFFDGSVGVALATHLEQPGSHLSDEEIQRLQSLIGELNEERGES